jgi:hypothetical protein
MSMGPVAETCRFGHVLRDGMALPFDASGAKNQRMSKVHWSKTMGVKDSIKP